MAGLGKLLIFSGLTLAVLGVLLLFAHKIPWLGRLPGDLLIKKGQFTLYAPLATSMLLSVVISLLLMFIHKR